MCESSAGLREPCNPDTVIVVVFREAQMNSASDMAKAKICATKRLRKVMKRQSRYRKCVTRTDYMTYNNITLEVIIKHLHWIRQ